MRCEGGGVVIRRGSRGSGGGGGLGKIRVAADESVGDELLRRREGGLDFGPICSRRRGGTGRGAPPTWSSLRPPEEARGGRRGGAGRHGAPRWGRRAWPRRRGRILGRGRMPPRLRLRPRPTGVEAGATKSPASSAATSSLVALMSSPWRRADAHERIFSRLSPTTSLTLVIASAEVAGWRSSGNPTNLAPGPRTRGGCSRFARARALSVGSRAPRCEGHVHADAITSPRVVSFVAQLF